MNVYHGGTPPTISPPSEQKSNPTLDDYNRLKADYNQLCANYNEQRQIREIQEEENKDLKAMVAMRDEKIEKMSAMEKLTIAIHEKDIEREREKREVVQKELRWRKILGYIPLGCVVNWAIFGWSDIIMPFSLWLKSIFSSWLDSVLAWMYRRGKQVDRDRKKTDVDSLV